jgi:uncharacterized membrane protein YdbT with pleckstrin-like domain
LAVSYVNSVLQPGERVVVTGRLHWIVYWHGIVLLVLGVVLLGWERASGAGNLLIEITAVIFVVLVGISFVHAWFLRWTTEIAVTDRRVIFKRGFITRHTVETNMDKVASVDVDQGILGRILDYGTVHVVGAGGGVPQSSADDVRGVEHWHRVAAPLTLRSAITAK